MGDILNLNAYRQERQAEWKKKNHRRLEIYLSQWLRSTLEMDFLQVSNHYQATQFSYSEEAWDYLDLRNIVEEELENNVIHALYQDLEKQNWFDRRFLTKEKLLEFCLSFYIMTSLKA